MASITRDSSPPEAPLPNGRGSAPLLAASRISTSSSPDGREGERAVSDGQALVGDGSGSPPMLSVRAAWPGRPAPRSPPRRDAQPPRCAACSALRPPRRARRGARRGAGPQGLDVSLGVVEREQSLGGLLGPGEHLVDGLAVLPGQRGERRATLRDRRQPRGVGVERQQRRRRRRPPRRRAGS